MSRRNKILLHVVIYMMVASQLLTPLHPIYAFYRQYLADDSQSAESSGLNESFTLSNPISAWSNISEPTIENEAPNNLVDNSINIVGYNVHQQTPPPQTEYATRLLDVQSVTNATAIVDATGSGAATTGANGSCVVVGFNGSFSSVASVQIQHNDGWRNYQSGHNVYFSTTATTCSDPTWGVSPSRRWRTGPWFYTIGVERPFIWRDIECNQSACDITPMRYMVIKFDSGSFSIGGIKVTGNFTSDLSDDDDDCDECADSDPGSQAQPSVGRPINPRTGTYNYSTADIDLQGIEQSINFKRFYISASEDVRDRNISDFGSGWSHNYNIRLIKDISNSSLVSGFLTSTGAIHRIVQSGSTYTFTTPFLGELTYLAGGITNYPDIRYRMILRDQTIYYFNDAGYLRLVSQANLPSGSLHNPIVLTYDTASPPKLTSISTTSGSQTRALNFTYSTTAPYVITQITDHTGRNVQYRYGTAAGTGTPSVLKEVTDVRNQIWLYSYGAVTTGGGTVYKLTQITDPSNRVIERQVYCSSANTLCGVGLPARTGGVYQQFYGAANDPNTRLIVQLQYQTYNSASGNTDVIVTDGAGNVTNYDYTGSGAFYASTTASIPSQTTTYNTQSGYRPATVTDARGNATTMTWSADGDTLENVVYDMGGSNPDVTLEYDYGSYNNLTTIRQILETSTRTTSYQYTNTTYPHLPTAFIDAAGNQTDFTYTAEGYLEEVIAPALNSLRYVTHYEYDVWGQRTLEVQNYVVQGGSDPQTWTIDQTENPPRWEYSGTPIQHGTNNDQNIITQYVYDSLGRQIETIDANGHRMVTQYDAAGNVTLTISNYVPVAGQPTTPPYTDGVFNANAPDRNLRTTMAYDASGNLTTMTDWLGRITHYEYDLDNRLVRNVTNYDTVINPAGDFNTNFPDKNINTRYVYDNNGNIQQMVDTLGHVDWACYDQLNRPYRLVQNATGSNPCAANYVSPTPSVSDVDLITTLVYDNNGNVTDVFVDGNGNGTAITTGSNGSTTTDTEDIHTRYIYDALNRQTQVIYNYGDGVFDVNAPDQDVTTRTAYNLAGNVQRTLDPANRTTWMCYDALNRLTVQVVDALEDPCLVNFGYDYVRPANATSDQVIITKYYYDALGRLTHSIDPLGRRIQYSYDALQRTTQTIENFTGTGTFNQLIPDQNVTESIAYNRLGWVLQTTRIGSTSSTASDRTRMTCFRYDELGRQTHLIQSCVDGITNANEVDTDITQFTDYNAAGLVEAQSDPNGFSTAFEYDALDRLKLVRDPLLHETQMAYDAFGNVRSMTDALGNATIYAYDLENRQRQTISPAPQNPTTSTNYNRFGWVTAELDANARQTSYSYDRTGRIIGVIENVVAPFTPNNPNAPDRNIQTLYGYDVSGNLLKITLPHHTTTSPAIIQHSYDALNRRVGTDGLLNGTADIWTTTYDQIGRPVTMTTPNVNSQRSLTYDGLDRLTNIGFADANTPDVTFSYDALGRRSAMQDGWGTTSYTYDVMDRVTAVADPASRTLTYAYDRGSRRTALNMPGNRNVTYQYNAGDELERVTDWDSATTDTTYTYDNAGRVDTLTMPNGVIADYGYDSGGRLISIQYKQNGRTIAQYTYQLDNEGNRTQAVELSGGLFGIGYYENTDQDLTYNGSWLTYSDSTASGGSIHYSTGANDTIRFKIYGEALIVYRTEWSSANDAGLIEVCVENVCQLADSTDIGGNGKFGSPIIVRMPQLGIYDVEIHHVAADPGLIGIDAIEVVGTMEITTPGIYEENEIDALYDGVWTDYSYNPAWGTTGTNTTQAGADITFKVDGNTADAVVIYRQTYSGYGDLDVYLDDNPQPVATVPFAGTTIQNKSAYYLKLNLTSGTHTITLRNKDARYVVIEAIQIVDLSTITAGTQVQDNGPELTYVGNWTLYTEVGTGVTTRYTNNPTSSIRFKIDGYGIALYRTMWSTGYGPLEICIDNNPCQTVQNTSTTNIVSKPYMLRLDTGGIHEVTIRNTSTNYIGIDSVKVLGQVQPLTAGYYEETEEASGFNITYTGTWTEYTAAPPNGPLGGTSRFTNTLGDKLTLQVDAAQIDELVIFRSDYAAYYGAFQIYVDNNLFQTIPATTATGSIQWGRAVSIDLRGLTDVVHTIEIRNGSTQYLQIESFQLVGTLQTVSVGKTDDNVPQITYIGPWPSPWLNSGAYLGNSHYTTHPDGEIRFQFTGDNLTLYRVIDNQRSNMNVCIDSTCTQVINRNASAVPQWQQPVSFNNLTNGTHTVSIKRIPNTGTYLDLDAVEIVVGGGLSIEPTNTETPTATVTSTETTPTATGSVTATPAGTTTVTATTTVIATPSETSTALPTESPTATPVPPTETALPTLTPVPTDLPTVTPEPPTLTPEPSGTPIAQSDDAKARVALRVLAQETTPESTPAPEITPIAPEVTTLPEITPDTSALIVPAEVPLLDLVGGPAERIISYTYDGMQRLDTASYAEDGVANARVYDYGYDLIGNRLSQAVTVSGTTTTTSYTYNVANQLATSKIGTSALVNYSYDPAGNMITAGANTYAYDAANRLTSYTAGGVTSSYLYNGEGDRYRQTVGGVQTNYLLDAQYGLTQVLGEFTPSSDTYYLMGLDVVGQRQGTNWSYFGYDGLGSTRFLTNPAGVATYNASYFGFSTPFKFYLLQTRLFLAIVYAAFNNQSISSF